MEQQSRRIINQHHHDTFDGNPSPVQTEEKPANDFNHMGEQFFSDCPNCLGAEGDHSCTKCAGLGIVEKPSQYCRLPCSPSDFYKGGKCDLNGCYHE